ncbi:MAG: hypothetical protein NC407_08320 [Lachnoclostridium sp.]|nr:hypothetical protein [Lachnoclostridium sp.]
MMQELYDNHTMVKPDCNDCKGCDSCCRQMGDSKKGNLGLPIIPYRMTYLYGFMMHRRYIA